MINNNLNFQQNKFHPTFNGMKKSLLILLLLIIILPLPALAWPAYLHDDGGPYRDLAVAADGQLVLSAVLMPTTIELTILNPAGVRLAWSTFELPEDVWQIPVQKISVNLYSDPRGGYELTVPLVAGDLNGVSYAALFSARIIVRNNVVTVTPQARPQVLVVPAGAKDMSVLAKPTEIYLIWRTLDEDNIGTVMMNRINRITSVANVNAD